MIKHNHDFLARLPRDRGSLNEVPLVRYFEFFHKKLISRPSPTFELLEPAVTDSLCLEPLLEGGPSAVPART